MALAESTDLIHPNFAAAARAAASAVDHEGSLPGDQVRRASEDGVVLELGLSRSGAQPMVAAARHRGAQDPILRGVLETFCAAIEGLPLREAADHGAIHAIERLRGDALARPVPGILTSHSAGRAFTCCERLVRGILSAEAGKTGDKGTANFWTRPLSATWRGLSDDGRIAALKPVLHAFRTQNRLGEDDIWIAAVEKTRRIVIGFGPAVDYREKPGLLMRLEVEMRRSTGDQLELFMSEAKDSNPIRRLAPEEERS